MPGVLSRIRRDAHGLTETLWASRDADELMDTVAEIEALKSTLDGLELAVVRELDSTNGVKAVGWASTQDFVTAITGGHKGTGPATVRLATAVDAPLLAPVGEALRDGWLSTAKAQVIERAIDTLPGNPDLRSRGVQVLLDEAKRLDATELRKVTRRLLAQVDPDGQDRRDELALDRDELAASPDPHRRRTAMTAPLWFVKYGDEADVEAGIAIAELLHADPDALVHKPVGIYLAYAGDRLPERLTEFLDRHGKAMPRAAYRIATRKRRQAGVV